MQPAMNTVNRSHMLDEHYFDDVDTEEKAYWLGFLWADGSINKTAARATAENRLTLAQKEAEKDHLRKFLDAIKADYPIRTRHATNICYVDINSRRMCDSLIALGYANKDVRTHIPAIRNDLLPHFVRGYFDGDGCLSIYEQHVKQWTIHKQEWSITGNPVFIDEIKALLERDAGTTSTVKAKTYARTTKAVSLRYGKKHDVENLYNYMYSNATVFMTSKHDKFMRYFSYHKS